MVKNYLRHAERSVTLGSSCTENCMFLVHPFSGMALPKFISLKMNIIGLYCSLSVAEHNSAGADVFSLECLIKLGTKCF